MSRKNQTPESIGSITLIDEEFFEVINVFSIDSINDERFSITYGEGTKKRDEVQCAPREKYIVLQHHKTKKFRPYPMSLYLQKELLAYKMYKCHPDQYGYLFENPYMPGNGR